MTNDAKLEPCPFCGGEAEIIHIEEGENKGGSCVSCTKCLASSNVEFDFKENFVSNWNRRTTLSAETQGGEREATGADWRPVHEALIDIVEGIGGIEHGTWRDEKGQRLKDTSAWMQFYVAVRKNAPRLKDGTEREVAYRDQVLAIVRQHVAPAWCSVDRLVDAILALRRPAAPAPVAGLDLVGLVNGAVDDLNILPHWHDGLTEDQKRNINAAFQNGVEVAADAILAALTAGAEPRATDAGEGAGLTAYDHAVIARCVERQPKLFMRGQHEGYYIHSDIGDLIDIIGRLAAPDADKPEPRDGEAVGWTSPQTIAQLRGKSHGAYTMWANPVSRESVALYTHPPKPDARLSVAVKAIRSAQSFIADGGLAEMYPGSAVYAEMTEALRQIGSTENQHRRPEPVPEAHAANVLASTGGLK